MKDDELDRILSNEEAIIPSSGFVGSVMDDVRREAAAPPPIPFPWTRALPGIAAMGCALATLGVAMVMLFTQESASQPPPVILSRAFSAILEAAKSLRAGWVALALVLSLLSVKLSSRSRRARTTETR